MKPLVVIPSTANREHMLWKLLNSIDFWQERDAYDYVLVLQGYTEAQQEGLRFALGCSLEWKSFDRLLGPHVARQTALETNREREHFIMLDDDQEMLPDTSFVDALRLSEHPLTGLVCIRQAASPGLVAQRRRTVRGVEQSPFVCTDGGMALARHTADVIRAMPPAAYSCDNTEWSLAVYMSGLMNLIDHNHWSLHRAGSRGGRRASPGRLDDGWLSVPRVTPDPRFVRFPEMKQKLPDVHEANRVGWTRGFTAAAHAAHHAAARERARAWEEQCRTKI